MPKSSQKKIDTVVAYNRAHGAITIRPSKDIDAMIRKAASDAGVPLQRWIIDTLMDKIEQESKGRE